jgi:hypothetical protein
MKIEILVAIVAAFAAIVSAALAYTAQERATKAQADVSLIQLATQQAHERQKPFIEAQIKYYVEATETTAKILRTPEGPARDDLVKRFWQLYWGALALVEDDEVARAMVAYGEALKASPKQAGELERRAIDVAHACRNSLKSLWVPQLGPIQAVRPAS